MAAGDVRVVGSWDDWATPGHAPELHDAQWRLARLELPPGEHGYLLQRGDETALDPFNPLTTWRGDEEVSLAIVDDCSAPAIRIDDVRVDDEGNVQLAARFLAARDGSGVDPSTVEIATADGRALLIDSVDESSGNVAASIGGLGAGKHSLRAHARDQDGTEAEAARAVAWASPKMADWADGVIYQVVLDRYRDNGGAPLAAPATPGSRAGGTLDGLRAEIEAGTFDALGVTALLLSPVYDNPDGEYPGLDGHAYQGYHGYWVAESRRVEPELGSEAALEAAVTAAHARGIAVLLDIVPNHLHEDNPRYAEHRADGWFQEDGCVCGTTECPWSSNMSTCSFTSYLPDVRLQEPAAMRAAVDDAVWWTERFGVDGVRIDAVPMMPRAATRRIAHALREHAYPRRGPGMASFVMGEVFTGPGEAALEEIRYHLGPAGLDGAFDFPSMWSLRDAIATGNAGFTEVEELLAASAERFAGSGVRLARMLNNHDTARFISAAAGDAYGDTWSEPAAQPVTDEPYHRLAIAFAAVFTLPGMPLLYHGDEVGLAGAGDPDSRRVMPADAELLEPQRALRERIQRLSKLRTCSAALRRGDRVPLAVAHRTYAYLRGTDMDAPAVVVLSASSSEQTVQLVAGAMEPGAWVDAISGTTVEVAAGSPIDIEMPALSYRVLLRANDPCR
jgi:glycosidase